MEHQKSIKALCVFLICGCTGSNVEKSQSDNFFKLFRGELRIVDMTYTINDAGPFWPNEGEENPFNYTPIITHPDGSSALGQYSTVEHYGTHLDAPVHFKNGQISVDQIAVGDLFAPAVVIDVKNKCAENNDYRLSVPDIENWEEKNGRIPEGAVVFMLTGWGNKWSDQPAYRNQDSQGRMHFPGFSVEANEFLVNERNINGLGIDNLSIDYGLSADFEAHKVTNGAGKYHLENVANLDQIPESGAYIIVAPIKIEGGSGGQVRVFGIIPQ